MLAFAHLRGSIVMIDLWLLLSASLAGYALLSVTVWLDLFGMGYTIDPFHVVALPALAKLLDAHSTGTEPRLGLVAQRAQQAASVGAAEVLGYGAAVPGVDLTRPCIPDDTLRCDKHVATCPGD